MHNEEAHQYISSWLLTSRLSSKTCSIPSSKPPIALALHTFRMRSFRSCERIQVHNHLLQLKNPPVRSPCSFQSPWHSQQNSKRHWEHVMCIQPWFFSMGLYTVREMCVCVCVCVCVQCMCAYAVCAHVCSVCDRNKMLLRLLNEKY
jgi:hypothetical protein